MTTTRNGYWVLMIRNLQTCCLLEGAGRVTPILPTADCVKRFATENDAWECFDEIGAPQGMFPYFVQC